MASKKKKQNFTFKFTTLNVVIFLIISTLLVFFGIVFKDNIESLLNYNSITTIVDYNGLVMHTIDVGQAEAIIIKLPDNKNMMIDSGNNTNESRTKLLSYLENTFFVATENKKIDYFILTHSDADHVGGVEQVFDEYEILKTFRPKIYSSKNSDDVVISNSLSKCNIVDTKIYATAITSINNEGCEIEFIESGIEINQTSYSINFYAPVSDYYSNVNAYSPIITIEYCSKIIMLTGDITSESETEVLENYTLPIVDVLNVAHHGSKYSSCSDFLEAIKPKYAVISCGGRFDHPNVETLNRLSKFMNENCIFRTDKNGNIIVNITQEGKIGVLVDVGTFKANIKMEYLLVTIIIALFCLLFVKKTSKIKNKK